MSRHTLTDLAATIAARRGADADASYTRSLLDAGIAKCARKFGEEATEAIIAAMEKDKAALRAEAADVLYHLLVLLEASDVSLAEVERELEGRIGRSGLEEKAARAKT
ncbi:MAG: phosphoribosyl-ATP diphosphatase [Rhodobiaceae bacterium]|nr:phosphoribosyl-ATP diphosphatase [Rhodobiaceae bacterium]